MREAGEGSNSDGLRFDPFTDDLLDLGSVRIGFQRGDVGRVRKRRRDGDSRLLGCDPRGQHAERHNSSTERTPKGQETHESLGLATLPDRHRRRGATSSAFFDRNRLRLRQLRQNSLNHLAVATARIQPVGPKDATPGNPISTPSEAPQQPALGPQIGRLSLGAGICGSRSEGMGRPGVATGKGITRTRPRRLEITTSATLNRVVSQDNLSNRPNNPDVSRSQPLTKQELPSSLRTNDVEMNVFPKSFVCYVLICARHDIGNTNCAFIFHESANHVAAFTHREADQACSPPKAAFMATSGDK